jgi:hypothetical protein
MRVIEASATVFARHSRARCVSLPAVLRHSPRVSAMARARAAALGICCAALLCCASALTPPGPDPSTAGFIKVPNTHDAHLFYWLFDSRSSTPDTDPLVLCVRMTLGRRGHALAHAAASTRARDTAAREGRARSAQRRAREAAGA